MVQLHEWHPNKPIWKKNSSHTKDNLGYDAKNTGFGIQNPGTQAQLCHLCAVCYWASDTTSLSLRVLSFAMTAVMAAP